MALPLDDVYQKIGQAISKDIRGSWASVFVTAKFRGEGTLAIEGSYVDANGVNQIFAVPDTALKEIYYLFMRMSALPKGKWKSMTYQLMPDGQFEVEFGY